MALGRSPTPPEIRSPERDRAEDAETEEEFGDAFDIPHKNASHDRLRRWRQAALVLNASRRFRYTLDLKKEEEKEMIRRKIRAHAQVIRVVCHSPADVPCFLFWLYLFLHSKFGFSRQHFFSKKLGKKISEVVRWGRSVYANIQKFIQFQLTVNVAALVINVVAAVSSGDVPLNAVELLWVNLIMDTLGALALATEPPTDNLMKRQPVGRREPLVTNIMWRNLFVQALYQIAILLIFDFAGIRILRLQNGSRDNAEKMKNTFIFNAFVFCQMHLWVEHIIGVVSSTRKRHRQWLD